MSHVKLCSFPQQTNFLRCAGDLAAGLATIVLLALRLLGLLQIWHVYAAVAFAGAFEVFQYPTYRAAITLMVDKAHYGRTTALMGLANNTSRILAPIFV